MRRLIVTGSVILVVIGVLVGLAPGAFACPPPDCGTPGYWKTHDWPVDYVTVGGISYSQEEAQPLMKQIPGDMSSTLFRDLVAAKLNWANGCYSDSTIGHWVWLAQWWFYRYGPVGSGIGADSDAWQVGCVWTENQGGDQIHAFLDCYNNNDY